jgi:hypothetical protein
VNSHHWSEKLLDARRGSIVGSRSSQRSQGGEKALGQAVSWFVAQWRDITDFDQVKGLDMSHLCNVECRPTSTCKWGQ